MAKIGLRNRPGNIVAYALVDDQDYDWLSEWEWRIDTRGYAVRCKGPGIIFMHRLILGLEYGDGLFGDHRNGDRLDNRRENLRVVNHKQNSHNQRSVAGTSSRFRGVSWHRGHGKWQAQVRVDDKLHHLGSFDDEEEAARVAADFRAKHMSHAVES